ncbi:hypothetical protein Zmor_002313 [Zophobas morio]|uniref:Carbonic anhydrase n=1 Tax=Zophobas morio TaxID=2755281 RepID=A0AA38J4J4_9CUCU|nr:hypothetical protein Zmor_002313 [Zophobas morio]
MVNTIARLACMVMLGSFLHSGFASLARSGWNYNEDDWPIECKMGTKQSPIALSADIAQEENFSSFIFEQYDVTYPVQSKNNGHSVEIRLHVENQPTVKGGGLPHVYVLDHLHFHWESEHVIEDQRFPLELHLVHYASRYGNLSEALKYTGGVTVFSVLFYLSPDDDAHFVPLIDVIDKIQDQVNTIQEMHIRVDDFLPRDRAGFYRYNGSLTTPSCTEGIIWTVFTNKLPISKDQVKAFPYLKTEENEELRKNYRSLQKLNGRRVQIRRSPLNSSSGSMTVDVMSKLVTLFLFLKEAISFI